MKKSVNLIDSIVRQATRNQCFPLEVTVVNQYHQKMASFTMQTPQECLSMDERWDAAMNLRGACWVRIEPSRPTGDIRCWMKRIEAYERDDRSSDGIQRHNWGRKWKIQTFSNYEELVRA